MCTEQRLSQTHSVEAQIGTMKFKVMEVESEVMLLMHVSWVSGAISRSVHTARLVHLFNVHRLRF
jgi:hypothetical protein